MKSEDGVNWTKLADGKTFAYHKDDEKLIIGIGNDINLVATAENEDAEVSFRFVRINRDGFSGCPTAIRMDGQQNIFVGTSDGKIYTASLPEYSSLLNGNIPFEEKQLNFEDPGQINDFEFRDFNDQFRENNYILASMTNYVAESGYEKKFTNQEFLFDNCPLCDMIQLGDATYVCGENGLSSLNGTTIVASKSIPAMSKCDGNLFYITKDSKTILKVYRRNGTTDEQVFQFRVDENAVPTDLAVVRSGTETLYFFSTTRGLYYHVGNATKQMASSRNYPTRELDASVIGDSIVVYASQRRGDKNYFTVYELVKRNGSFVIETDTGTIEGLDRERPSNNTSHSGFISTRGGYAYVDGRNLRDKDGNIISSFDSSIAYTKKIQRGLFADNGTIIGVGSEFWFIDDTYQESYRINFTHNSEMAPPAISDILDFTTGSTYVYVIASDRIYICRMRFSNFQYILNIEGVFNSAQDVLKSGY